MQSNLATKFLPIVSDEKKIEVSLVDDQAVIKLSTWTEDLGWCGQKTLTIDAEMLDDLHRVIASARYKVNNKKSESSDNFETKKVLEFPKFS
jgi:predicted DCC family thiol-disulfide oxidoreductase YuxK